MLLVGALQRKVCGNFTLDQLLSAFIHWIQAKDVPQFSGSEPDWQKSLSPVLQSTPLERPTTTAHPQTHFSIWWTDRKPGQPTWIMSSVFKGNAGERWSIQILHAMQSHVHAFSLLHHLLVMKECVWRVGSSRKSKTEPPWPYTVWEGEQETSQGKSERGIENRKTWGIWAWGNTMNEKKGERMMFN